MPTKTRRKSTTRRQGGPGLDENDYFIFAIPKILLNFCKNFRPYLRKFCKNKKNRNNEKETEFPKRYGIALQFVNFLRNIVTGTGM